MADHYGAGTRFERVTKRDLEANGYVVTRAASSKGKLDLIAVKPGELVFAQCKRSGVIAPAEWDRVVELAGWVNATPLLVMAGATVEDVVYVELLGPKVPNRSMAFQRAKPWSPNHGFEPASNVEVVSR